jgi:hypothetical protein
MVEVGNMKAMTAGYIWVLVGMFFFAVLFMALNEVYTTTYSYANTEITTASSREILGITDIIWTYFPFVILIGGYLMYLISKSQKEYQR